MTTPANEPQTQEQASNTRGEQGAPEPSASSAANKPSERPYINTLAAVAIAPSGVGDELSQYVSQAVRVIRESGLPNETNAMFTNIEGDLDDVLRVVRDATLCLASQGYRTGVSLKLDIRPGYTGQIHAKAKLVNEILRKADQEKADQEAAQS